MLGAEKLEKKSYLLFIPCGERYPGVIKNEYAPLQSFLFGVVVVEFGGGEEYCSSSSSSK